MIFNENIEKITIKIEFQTKQFKNNLINVLKVFSCKINY